MKRIDCGAAHPYGICPVCHRGHGYAIPTPSTAMSETYEIAKLHARIQETKEWITYWKRQQILRELRSARADAGALVLLYQSQLRVLNAKLEALKANLTPA